MTFGSGHVTYYIPMGYRAIPTYIYIYPILSTYVAGFYSLISFSDYSLLHVYICKVIVILCIRSGALHFAVPS